MGPDTPQRRSWPGDSKSATILILRAVATLFQDRADRWLKADKTHDIEEPQFRYSRYFSTFSNLGEDLKQYSFDGAFKALEMYQADAAAEIHAEMTLLQKDLWSKHFVFEPEKDSVELDPIARRLSRVSQLFGRVAKDLEATTMEAETAGLHRPAGGNGADGPKTAQEEHGKRRSSGEDHRGANATPQVSRWGLPEHRAHRRQSASRGRRTLGRQQ